MNPSKHLILLKGEDKTRDIQFCRYNSQTQKYDVTFSNDNRSIRIFCKAGATGACKAGIE